MIFWYVVWAVVAIVAFTALSPKPSQTAKKPPGFGEIEAPTAEEGREIPVLFGTYIIESPNVVWYGDFEATAVQK